ncbi:hypothetical protein HanRHA438_Chr06g0283731 [Helianthus annuus]|nr:hypothetical protein HanRHA438_Chr06g0283731 [Helianthus annuus]
MHNYFLRPCVVEEGILLGVLRHVAVQSAMRHYGAFFSKMGVVGMLELWGIMLNEV